ncbi:twin-arginine translocase TatA/TatE family subunit [Tepidiforma flava]|uniref:Sec-independent protein translocase protein TatA n=1 Tax=Tepidiforma flava TaxID=3004094 RepID=A0ABY7M7B1_9CHLR|nr:twin-arginine translocase TatA/TatE family subunit [Tepidiforma flava]WBL35666.1 twin-arginine translocase TatA/TatE family subunit [Tepidiforma flava]
MFGSLGAPELIIIALVIVLIFGVGKISGLGRELGTSIKEFRRAVKDEDEAARQQQTAAPPPQYQQTVQAPPPPPPVAAQPPAAAPPNNDPNKPNTPNVF